MDVTCKNGDVATDAFVVDGVLLIAIADVLKRLVDDGPRTLLVKNKEAEEVTVEILTGLAPSIPSAAP